LILSMATTESSKWECSSFCWLMIIYKFKLIFNLWRDSFSVVS
jgi:hypothetical protein